MTTMPHIASISYVLARRYTPINADQALLTGLLHALGRLYVVMRADDRSDVTPQEIRDIANGWQAVIGKAILESWGLPEALQHAVEHQDDIACERNPMSEIGERADGPASLTDVLVTAKILHSDEHCPEAAGLPAVRWLSAITDQNPARVLEDHAEEIDSLRRSFGGQ